MVIHSILLTYSEGGILKKESSNNLTNILQLMMELGKPHERCLTRVVFSDP